MQLSDALCYVLMITISSTCVNGRYTRQELEKKSDRRGRRESSVIIDSAYPSTTYTKKPDLIFDRVSNSKYGSKPKHGRKRPQYNARTPQSPRSKPVKKYRRKLVRAHKFKKYVPTPNSHLHLHPFHTKAPKQVTPKMPLESGYSPPKLWNEYHPYYVSEPSSFAEPPKYVNAEYERQPEKTYGEPPVDSYGVPIHNSDFQIAAESYVKPLKHQNLPTAEPFAESPNNGNFGQQLKSYQSYEQDVNVDNINSFSKYHPVYRQNKKEVHQLNQPPDHSSSLHSYADVYKQSSLNDLTSNVWNQESQNYNSIHKNRPWKSKINNEDVKENPQKHIIVGGQYAEPPGHLVPDVLPSLTEESSGASYFGPKFSYLDSEFAASASISPYVNYKNSNMAFSPQNLNDAFSL